MEGTSTCKQGSHAQHTHVLEDHTRSIQHLHSIQQQNKNHIQKSPPTLSNTQYTRQTDITLHSPQLRSKRQ